MTSSLIQCDAGNDMNAVTETYQHIKCMHKCLLLLLPTTALVVLGLPPLQCGLSVLVRLQAADHFNAQNKDSSKFKQPAREASARQS